MKQGIIFDMDGTLWDSAEQVAASWTLALHQCGYADVVVTKEDMYRTMGRTMDKIAEMLFPFTQGKEREDLLATCCAVENDYLRQHGGKLYPGMRQTMETLQKAGYHLYIVSNCQSGYIEAFLDYFSFHDLFEDILCFGDNGKPKGENIRLLYEKNHLDTAVYVGDIQGDYDATMQAGLPFIHAAYGFGQIDHPVEKIDALTDLPEVMKKIG